MHKMSTLTIHSLDPAVDRGVRQKARREGKSLNQTVKELLASSMGVGGGAAKMDNRAEFERFSGVWSVKDEAEFNAVVADCQRVDPSDWK
jgi:hypothetical protein